MNKNNDRYNLCKKVLSVALSTCMCMGGIVSASDDNVEENSEVSVSFAEKLKNSGAKYKDSIKKFGVERKNELIAVGGTSALAAVGFSMYKLGARQTRGMQELADRANQRAEQSERLRQEAEQRVAQANRQMDEAVAEANRRREEAVAEANRQMDEAVAEANRQRDDVKRAEEAIAEANRRREEAVAEANRQMDEAVAEANRQRDDVKRAEEAIAEANRRREEAVAEANRQMDEAVAEANRQREEAKRAEEARKACSDRLRYLEQKNGELTEENDRYRARFVTIVTPGIIYGSTSRDVYFHDQQEGFLNSLECTKGKWDNFSIWNKCGKGKKNSRNSVEEAKKIYLARFNSVPEEHRYGIALELASVYFDKFIVPHSTPR